MKIYEYRLLRIIIDDTNEEDSYRSIVRSRSFEMIRSSLDLTLTHCFSTHRKSSSMESILNLVPPSMLSTSYLQTPFLSVFSLCDLELL